MYFGTVLCGVFFLFKSQRNYNSNAEEKPINTAAVRVTSLVLNPGVSIRRVWQRVLHFNLKIFRPP